jgi:hypothetical protein
MSPATKFSGLVAGAAALSVCAIVALSKRRHWLDLATQHLTQRLIRQVERETGLPVARSSRRQWLKERRQQLARPTLLKWGQSLVKETPLQAALRPVLAHLAETNQPVMVVALFAGCDQHTFWRGRLHKLQTGGETWFVLLPGRPRQQPFVFSLPEVLGLTIAEPDAGNPPLTLIVERNDREAL